MANHVLRQIRDAAKSALNGLTTAASQTTRAFVNRSDDEPLLDAELPAYRLRVRTDDITVSSLGVNRLYERSAELVVEAIQKKNATFEDDAYDLIKLAEVAIAGGLTGAKSVDIRRIEIEDDARGEKPRILARMTFAVYYVTAIGSPDIAL
jgi:hypothetical protein